MMIQNWIKLSAFSLLAAMSTLVPVANAQLFRFPASTVQTRQVQTRQTAQTTAPSFQALEQAVHNQVNQYRRSRGLPALTLDPRISAQALAHSQAMASGRVPFSHNGFQQRVQVIAKAIPYRGAAENVAYNMGYKDPDRQAVQNWLKSPGHRKNIEGQFDLTGIGISRNAKGEYYFTRIFIRRR